MKTNASLRRFVLTAFAAALLAPGIATAAPPTIYVANDTANSGAVPAFDASGAAATGYTTPGGFSAATGVAFDPVSNTLYVADNANTPTLRTFNATTGAETTPTGFANAAGLNGPEACCWKAATCSSPTKTVTTSSPSTPPRARPTRASNSPAG